MARLKPMVPVKAKPMKAVAVRMPRVGPHPARNLGHYLHPKKGR